jgi:3-oxoacyl-[acyl-carrier protein] reductase
MARSAAPHMVGAGWGRIVNITTSLPTMQRRHNSPYGVTKAAIEAETLIWA